MKTPRHIISVNLDDDLATRADQAAKELNISRSEFYRNVMKLYLEYWDHNRYERNLDRIMRQPGPLTEQDLKDLELL